MKIAAREVKQKLDTVQCPPVDLTKKEKEVVTWFITQDFENAQMVALPKAWPGVIQRLFGKLFGKL